MMVRSLQSAIACSLLSLIFISAARAQDMDFSKIPTRPITQIMDEASWLTATEKEAATKELLKTFDEKNVDIYLVILPKLPPQGAESYARSLGQKWSRSPVWCVVFQVPGDPAGFHIEAGGAATEKGKLDQALVEAIRRARRENSEKDRFEAAWKEATEGLGFIYAVKQRQTEGTALANRDAGSKHHMTKIRRKVIIAAALLGSVLFLLLLLWIISRIAKNKFSYTFPNTSWRTRFQGPHSGGSGIVVSYRRKQLK